MFWSLAAAAVFAAALITFFPLLRGKSLWQPAGLALIFIVPAVSLWTYQKIGTPQAIDLPAQKPQGISATARHSEGAGDMESMIAGLRQRLETNPEDLEGWMLLARSYTSLQRFSDAAEALEKAHAIAPDNAFVMTELAEAWIFVSPDGRIGDDSLRLLQRALVIDPSQQKALWLLGVAAAQSGEFEYAIEQWETLLAMMEPGSDVAETLQGQIDEARQAQSAGGAAPAGDSQGAAVETAAAPAPAAEPEGWQGTRVSISAAEGLPDSVAASAVLYVMIRSPGPAMGPPIGVRRIMQPQLPLELTITDQDSMLKERRISGESEVQLQARLSLSGSPAAGPGDWQSGPVTISLDAGAHVDLLLDQQVE